MQIILVRHVETDANLNGMFSGWTDYPVTSRGKAQRIKVGKALKPYENVKKIYSSPLMRTRFTSEHISRVLKKKIYYREELKEVSFGIFEGKTGEYIEANHKEIWDSWNADFVNYSVPEGESIQDLKDRVMPFLNHIIEKDEDCVIVSHGAVIQTIVTQLLNFDLKDMWRFQFKNGSYTEIEYNEGFAFLKKLCPID